MLERTHHELATLSENALAVGRRLRAHGGLELALQTVEPLGVVGDLLGHRLGAGKRRVRPRDEALGGVDGPAHELAPLVGARELVRERRVLDLKAERGVRPLLGGADGVGVDLLARGGAAAVADAHRQVDVDVVVVGEQGEPQLARDGAHAREHDLVLLGNTLERARARDVALLVGRGRAGDLVVDLARGVAARGERLRGAHRGAQAALAAVVADKDGLVVNRDRVDRARLQAAGAHVLAPRRHPEASVGVGEGLLLVVGRVEDLALGLARDRAHHRAGQVGQGAPVALQVNELVQEVALLGHVSPLHSGQPHRGNI